VVAVVAVVAGAVEREEAKGSKVNVCDGQMITLVTASSVYREFISDGRNGRTKTLCINNIITWNSYNSQCIGKGICIGRMDGRKLFVLIITWNSTCNSHGGGGGSFVYLYIIINSNTVQINKTFTNTNKQYIIKHSRVNSSLYLTQAPKPTIPPPPPLPPPMLTSSAMIHRLKLHRAVANIAE